MATYYLLNDTWVGTVKRPAGEFIDDAIETVAGVANIVASGGRLINTSFAGIGEIAAAATLVRERNMFGRPEGQVVMLSAAAKAAIENGGGGGGGGWTAAPLQAVNGGAFNLTTAMLGNLLLVDNTAAGRTVNLPAAPAAGFFCFVKVYLTTPAGGTPPLWSSNPLTLVPNGVQAIEGGAGGANRVVDRGTGFFILFWAGSDGWRMGPVDQNLVVGP